MSEETARTVGPHEVALLLPWYLGGQLTADERASVESHLVGCEVCRQELEQTKLLRGAVREAYSVADVTSPHLRQTVMSRISARPSEPRVNERLTGALRALLAPRWAPAALLLLVVAQFGALTWLLIPQSPPSITTRGVETYGARLRVSFRAEATQQSVQQALRELGARVVDGPDRDGSYVLELTGARPAASVAQRLRALQGPMGPIQHVEPAS